MKKWSLQFCLVTPLMTAGLTQSSGVVWGGGVRISLLPDSPECFSFQGVSPLDPWKAREVGIGGDQLTAVFTGIQKDVGIHEDHR